MDFEKLIKSTIEGVMNALEDCFSSFQVAAGKKTLEVFLTCIAFLVYSILMQIFGLVTVINWYEALTACLFMGVVTYMNYKNDSHIKKLKSILRKEKQTNVK